MLRLSLFGIQPWRGREEGWILPIHVQGNGNLHSIPTCLSISCLIAPQKCFNLFVVIAKQSFIHYHAIIHQRKGAFPVYYNKLKSAQDEEKQLFRVSVGTNWEMTENREVGKIWKWGGGGGGGEGGGGGGWGI